MTMPKSYPVTSAESAANIINEIGFPVSIFYHRADGDIHYSHAFNLDQYNDQVDIGIVQSKDGEITITPGGPTKVTELPK